MKKHKTEWDLSLLYRNNKDPKIEKDIKEIEGLCNNFEIKYRNKDFTSSPKKLLITLVDFNKLLEKLERNKSWWYFALKVRLNSSDQFSSASSTKLSARITEAFNKIMFFNLEIGKINKKDQNKFLNNPMLTEFRYVLQVIFKKSEFKLSEKEEQVIDLLSETSYGMWVKGSSKLVNEQQVIYKNKKIPLSEAISIMSDLETRDRRILGQKINQSLKSVSHFAEAEINAVYNYKNILDKRRGYKKPYSNTILNYKNNEETIEKLVKLVTKYFSLSKRFYSIQAKILKKKKLTYSDRVASIGKINKKFDLKSSIEIVMESFNKIDPKYGRIVSMFFENGQVDVYPKKGKSGGAFCWGMGDLPVFVFLNHTDDIRSVETLAHEMGHAIHTELSKSQPVQYRDYSMAVAEVASTFFEQVVIDELEKYLSDDDKIILLHNKIKGDISTIFRQIACFNFELELHNKIREKGELSKEEMASLLAKHMRAYLGDIVEVTEDDGYQFVSWSHIRRFFYVYSYAYGQLISRSLFENWKKDKSYAIKIEKFLSSGGSMSPEDIFNKAGIDTTDMKFFESGIKSIKKDIDKLEKISLGKSL
ncbi:MAG: M3 family oligoendopeptidase [Candidatus Paceibacterota bacterium]